MSEEIKNKILGAIQERVKQGKLDGKPEEIFSKMKEEVGRMFPYMNDSGRQRIIANRLDVSIEDDLENAKTPETICKIKDLKNFIGDNGPENISIKGKVMKSWIDRFPKKDEEGEWIVAKLELADETGSTLFTQFYDQKYGTLFHQIETGEIEKKTIVVRNIKVDISTYTVHETSIQLRKYGKIELSEEDLPVTNVTHDPTSLADAKDGKYVMLLLQVNEVQFRNKKEDKKGNTKFCSVNCIDQSGAWVSVTLWDCPAFTKNFKIEKGNIILAEGVFKEDNYNGKVYKKLNVNDKSKVTVNPSGYNFQKRDETAVEKGLLAAKIGDKIDSVVLVNKVFTRKKPYYLACQIENEKGRVCGKGVALDEKDNSWKCNGGHVLDKDDVKKIKRIGMLTGIVMDGDVRLNFTLFDRNGTVFKKLFQKDVDEISNSIEKNGEEREFGMMNEELKKFPFRIQARVSEDKSKGSISLTIEDVNKVDLLEESEWIKSSIKTTV